MQSAFGHWSTPLKRRLKHLVLHKLQSTDIIVLFESLWCSGLGRLSVSSGSIRFARQKWPSVFLLPPPPLPLPLPLPLSSLPLPFLPPLTLPPLPLPPPLPLAPPLPLPLPLFLGRLTLPPFLCPLPPPLPPLPLPPLPLPPPLLPLPHKLGAKFGSRRDGAPGLLRSWHLE